MKKTTYTIFGDSLAKGMCLKNGRPVMLENTAVKMIEEHFNIEINNCSCFGQTIKRVRDKGLIDEYIKSLNKKERNVVVFCIGGNDSDFDWKIVDKAPESEHHCKTEIQEFVEIYKELILKLKKQKAEIYLCGLPVVSAKMFFEKYISLFGDKENILKFFKGDITFINRHHEIFSNAIKDLATETKVNFLDIRTPFLKKPDLEHYYCIDGLHPNERGHKLIAEAVIKYFEK